VERADAEDAHRRYESADRRVKELVKAAGIDKGICGDFAISVTERNVRGYEVKARTDRVVKIVRAVGAAARQEVA